MACSGFPGMGPQGDADDIASLFVLERDDGGFFVSGKNGVHVAGTCEESERE